MNRNRIAIFALGVACALLVVASVFAADANVGTWKINLTKSKYDPPNLAPKSTTAKNEASEGGIKVTVDAVDYTGKSLHYDYSVKYDGKDAPVKGDPNRDMTSMKKIDDNTFEQTRRTVKSQLRPGSSTLRMESLEHSPRPARILKVRRSTILLFGISSRSPKAAS